MSSQGTTPIASSDIVTVAVNNDRTEVARAFFDVKKFNFSLDRYESRHVARIRDSKDFRSFFRRREKTKT